MTKKQQQRTLCEKHPQIVEYPINPNKWRSRKETESEEKATFKIKHPLKSKNPKIEGREGKFGVKMEQDET